LLFNVFKCEYADQARPQISQHLCNDRNLSAYIGNGVSRGKYINVSSVTKSHHVTHRRSKRICENPTDSDVCLHNGLTYGYYDCRREGYCGGYITSEEFPISCMYSLPQRS
jgi:hypothetical protein